MKPNLNIPNFLLFWFFKDYPPRYKAWEYFSLPVRNYKALRFWVCADTSSSWRRLHRLRGHPLVQSSRAGVERHHLWKVCILWEPPGLSWCVLLSAMLTLCPLVWVPSVKRDTFKGTRSPRGHLCYCSVSVLTPSGLTAAAAGGRCSCPYTVSMLALICADLSLLFCAYVLQRLNDFIFIYLFMCGACGMSVEVREISSFQLCGSLRPNSGRQTQWQVPLPAEPSCQPYKAYVIRDNLNALL